MAKGRKTQVTKNPKTGRWRLYARPATETTYLGGLTAPGITRRPHMGPFNRVTDYKISDADEVYRRHDIGYGKELAAGRSPYTRWNKYDQELMDAPSTGWPDYIAKAVFGAKRFVTFGIPHTEHTRLKDVYGTRLPSQSRTSWQPTSYNDFTNTEYNAPVIYEGKGVDPDVLELQQQLSARKWANKGNMWEADFTRQNTDYVGGGNRNIYTTIRYGTY